MSVYREKDGSITREYSLEEEQPIFQKRTERALVEIVPTKEFGKALFIDNELQLTEKDEYIYHEMLVHPCLALSNCVYSVCVIGGGDGCAVREVLKWKDIDGRKVQRIDVIDWDEEVTDLFQGECSDWNENALNESIVTIENEDIAGEFEWEDRRDYDVVIVDLTDPDFTVYGQRNLWESVLYAVKKWGDKYGSIVINAGGITPTNTENLNVLLEMVRDSFSQTMNIHLYKVFVPSFGREWCFILMNQQTDLDLEVLPNSLRYCSKYTWQHAYKYGWCKEYLENIYLNLSHQLPEEEDE